MSMPGILANQAPGILDLSQAHTMGQVSCSLPDLLDGCQGRRILLAFSGFQV
jgi:hypothetical protein